MRVDGTRGMTVFYDTCLSTLYPPGELRQRWAIDAMTYPHAILHIVLVVLFCDDFTLIDRSGHCADECTPSMMHCRMMEVQAACCGDERNCPDNSPVPRQCPVQCALVFPTLVEGCSDELEEDGVDIDAFREFADECMRQDTTALVEYAMELEENGCTIDLEDGRGRRRTEGHDIDTLDGGASSTFRRSYPLDHGSRQLQEPENPACKDFEDDPEGILAAADVSCEQVIQLGCDTDLHSAMREIPEGSLVSLLCPVSCNDCHRTGMAKWVETPVECQWDDFDTRLDKANEVCCGDNPDRQCPRGAPPRECSALCSVTFHRLTQDCSDTLTSLLTEESAGQFAEFDALVSENVISLSFILHSAA
eukprot:SAG31_NODE_602_length_13638_cov_32.936037_19_plen_363_part_00